jgi:hypothetical protein
MVIQTKVNFHENRCQTGRYQIVAICLNGLVVPIRRTQEEEWALLDMMAEFHEWQERGIQVPPVAICLAHSLMNLLPELERRLAILKATEHLTRLSRISPRARRHKRY